MTIFNLPVLRRNGENAYATVRRNGLSVLGATPPDETDVFIPCSEDNDLEDPLDEWTVITSGSHLSYGNQTGTGIQRCFIESQNYEIYYTDPISLGGVTDLDNFVFECYRNIRSNSGEHSIGFYDGINPIVYIEFELPGFSYRGAYLRGTEVTNTRIFDDEVPTGQWKLRKFEFNNGQITVTVENDFDTYTESQPIDLSAYSPSDLHIWIRGLSNSFGSAYQWTDFEGQIQI